jgi:hypothetical protein
MTAARRVATGLFFMIVAASTGCAATADDDGAEASVGAVSNGRITMQNWATHPRIVEIRTLVQQIEDELRAARTVPTSRECSGEDTSSSRVMSSQDGKVRKLNLYTTDDRGWQTIDIFYDQRGKARYVHQIGFQYESHVSNTGTASEDHVFYDEEGEDLWHVARDQRLEAQPDPWTGALQLPPLSEVLEAEPFRRSENFAFLTPTVLTDPAAYFTSSCTPEEPEDGAGAGEPCGGFAGIECRAGLTCDNSAGLGAGYCR